MFINNKFYRCYSNPIKEFAMENGCRYVLIAKDCVTDKLFWLFERTDKFNNSLEEWKRQHPRI